MDLRTFIKTALLDIVGGVQDAQKETDEATVVPKTKIEKTWVELGVTRIQVIDFEILVRADEANESQGKIGVVGGLFGAGVSGNRSTESGQESKVKLRIPVQLPSSGAVRTK